MDDSRALKKRRKTRRMVGRKPVSRSGVKPRGATARLSPPEPPDPPPEPSEPPAASRAHTVLPPASQAAPPLVDGEVPAAPPGADRLLEEFFATDEPVDTKGKRRRGSD